MDRRRFIKNTTLGATALSLSIGSSAISEGPVYEPSAGVRELARACGAREWSGMAGRLAFGLFQPLLADQLNSDCEAFRNEKFGAENFSVFTLDGGRLVFLGMEKRLEALNQADYIVPFWGRKKEGGYRLLATLNGFQLEALLKAAGRLQSENLPADQIGGLLLPADRAGLATAEPGSFNTRHGKVSTKTVITEEQATTSIAVRTAGGTLLEEKFAAAYLTV